MKSLIEYVKPFKKFIIFLLIFITIQSVCEILLPTFLAVMINDGIAQNNVTVIYSVAFIMFGITIVSVASAIIASYFSSKTTTKIGANLRQSIFFKATDFSLEELDKFGTSSLITRTTNDVTQVQMFLTMLLRIGLLTPLMAISGIVMAIVTGGSLSLIFLFSIPLLAVVISFLLRKAMGSFKSMQKKIDAINLVFRENLTGVRVIRAFRRTDYEAERFKEVNYDYSKTSIFTQRLMGFLMPCVSVIMNITTVSVMYFGGQMVFGGSMDVGKLVAYCQYIMQILMSIIMVSMIFVMYPRASASADRINQVLKTEISVKKIGEGGTNELSYNEDINDTVSHRAENASDGLLVFKNVSFSYPDADEPVLHNLSFEARPNETTAIIGSTGSGKSTVANLIPRFYDVTEGEILIDGKNIKSYELEDLRKMIGYVPQKGVLFTGSIRDNLTLGKIDATDEELTKASEIAQVLNFINEKENGFESEIAQGGTNVSGGQKQRLSIARAIIKKPKIYLFDDSFSALDFKTDATLRKALKKEIKDSTTIIIAQRISTIMDANKIIVLNDGEVEDIGTHNELMERSTLYKEIVDSQLRKGELGA